MTERTAADGDAPKPVGDEPADQHHHLSPAEIEDELTRRRFIAVSTLALGVATNLRVEAVDNSPDSTSPATQPTPEDDVAQDISQDITLSINGQAMALQLSPRTTLLDALREVVHSTGTKKGCDHGQCGACTVLVNGRRIYSCLTLACMHSDSDIRTIEGLSQSAELHALQQEFINHDAFQCGYCTSGQLCSATALLAEGHANTDEEVRESMSGNICRCGAYNNIVAAIQAARRWTPHE